MKLIHTYGSTVKYKGVEYVVTFAYSAFRTAFYNLEIKDPEKCDLLRNINKELHAVPHDKVYM